MSRQVSTLTSPNKNTQQQWVRQSIAATFYPCSPYKDTYTACAFTTIKWHTHPAWRQSSNIDWNVLHNLDLAGQEHTHRHTTPALSPGTGFAECIWIKESVCISSSSKTRTQQNKGQRKRNKNQTNSKPCQTAGSDVTPLESALFICSVIVVEVCSSCICVCDGWLTVRRFTESAKVTTV